MSQTRREIIFNGLWHNNQALVALLGLCPLLAVTNSAVNGLGLGLATVAVLVASNASVSLIRNIVRPEIRLPVFVLIIASFVTAVELSMHAYFPELYKILGIFIPLIVTNCTIIGRAEAFASRNSLQASIIDGMSMGIGFLLVLVTLGGIRELIGQGTLFADLHLMLGEGARGLYFTLGDDYQGMLLAILPPGAFIGLGMLIAIKNLIDARSSSRLSVSRVQSADDSTNNTQVNPA
jgi:electron transport complex protein RnfE